MGALAQPVPADPAPLMGGAAAVPRQAAPDLRSTVRLKGGETPAPRSLSPQERQELRQFLRQQVSRPAVRPARP